MEKIKQFLSKLTLKHYIGIGVGVILIYLVFSFIFSSSSKGIELIPKNTVAVVVVNIGDIIDKADIEDIFELDLSIFKQFGIKNMDDVIEELDNESELLASILKKPEDIGIDINQDIFIYVVLEEIQEEDLDTFLCISGGVDDEDRLLEILEEIDDEYQELSIDEEDNYQIALTKGNSNVMAFAWDDDKFLYITGFDKYRWKDDEIDNLEDEVERLFNLDSKKKLTSINSFDDFYDNKTELCAWASPEGIDEDILEPYVKELEKETYGIIDLSEKDIQECSASLFVNFGDGEVSVEGDFYMSEAVEEFLQEEAGLETSDISFEWTMKFDDSGDNTIHVVLRSLLTIGYEKLLRIFVGYDASEAEEDYEYTPNMYRSPGIETYGEHNIEEYNDYYDGDYE